MDTTTKLTEKQEAFCQEYAVCHSAERAASYAGYADWAHEGYKLLKKPHILQRVKEVCQERSQRVGITKDFVLAGLLENYQRCMQEVKPQLNSKTGKPIEDDEGNPVYTYNVNAALKSLELIGKLVGVDAFNEKLNVHLSREKEMEDAISAGNERLKNAPVFKSES